MKKIISVFLSIFMILQSGALVYGSNQTYKPRYCTVISANTVSANLSGFFNIETKGDKAKGNVLKITSITFDKGYILGVKGSLQAKQIKFTAKMEDYTRKIIDGDQCQWYFSNPDIAQYAKGEIRILKKGTTTATVIIDGVSTTLLLFAKESEGENYVLYEEDFNSLYDGALPQGWIRKDGAHESNTAVRNSEFVIDARLYPVRIFLPEYLSKFGNYMIEADVTNVGANDPMRWNSIMYRIQNNNYPYFQMAVRKKSTSIKGVELAEKDISNSWNVIKTNFYYEDINDSKMYHYTVKAYDNVIQQWIGNAMLISFDMANMYPAGGIGFQANGSIMKIDNLKITLLEKPIETMNAPEGDYSRVREADTKIAMPPTIVTEIKDKKKFEEIITEEQAATAILTINKKLEVLGNGSSDVIGTVGSFYAAMKTKVIPAFRVYDSDTAKAISEYLKNNGIEDVFVISNSPWLVKQARENYNFIRGIVEFDNIPSNLDTNQLMNISNYANSNNARIVVLPSEAATKSNIKYLQQRLVTVWSKETTKADDTEKLVTLHKMITSGTNGILTDMPKKARNALAVYNHYTTIVRKPFLIGHRGVPELAPENTLEGSELAFSLGADMVENDIWLTKAGADGKQHVVVMHDDTIERTTNGRGKIYDKTLEQISKYFANKQFVKKFPTAKIPTLGQYFERFRGKDQVIFVEIKSRDPKTVDYYTELIKRVGAYEHAVTISSNDDQLKRTKEQIPEIPLGNIRGGYDFKTDIYGSLRYVLWEVQTLNSSLMPDYASINREFMEVAKHRGMTIWPWGFSDKDTIKQYFKMGAWGISTGHAYVVSDWAAEIIPNQSQILMKTGETSLLGANVKTYNGKIKEVIPDVVLLSGEECLEVSGNRVKSKKFGVAYVMLRYTERLSGDEEDVYDIYTTPIKILVE